ncbi:hypothetical protein HPB51_004023 [Rhipicephalus microplus]|uniref:Uncharacterized protein n=1 Tax=Rhipicephalus microplus TaxID=6941 RepID=A0A9J6EXE7_RHIMP|nr:hypothetical protein HPB51_004023 [Rhipicephalus microplus]
MADQEGLKHPKDAKHVEVVRPMVKLSQKQRKQMKATTPAQASSPPGLSLGEAIAPSTFPSPSSPPAEVPRMIDILRFEEQKVQNLEKVKPKALHIINLEDKAIEELLRFYNAEDNPEERITACRILPEAYAAPVWKKKH